MGTNPIVSAIIIFLNAERFLVEAIESILAQTYQHWELLLVDDGSTDDSTDIAKRYEAAYTGQVRYLEHTNHQNRGMSASRNLGIEHAKGEYIAFLDADDVWLPSKLQEQVTIIDQYPSVAMLYGLTLYWHSWTGKSENEQQDLVPPLSIQTNVPISPPALLPLYLRGKAAVPCTCSILVRRSSLNRVDGFEESFRGLYEDQAFYVKICLKFPVMAVDTCWDKYRQHPASSVAIAGQLTERTTARQFFLKWVAAYLVKQQINDNNIWQALRKELWLSSQPVWLLNLPKGSYILRWIKKWIIKLEETILPAKEW